MERKTGEGNRIDVTVNGNRGDSSPATSGQSPADKMCNIFDLEENYYEYVAEKNSDNDIIPFVGRGGNSGAGYSASDRYGDDGTASSSVSSFRFTLYVM